jgi:hypothetical protein
MGHQEFNICASENSGIVNRQWLCGIKVDGRPSHIRRPQPFPYFFFFADAVQMVWRRGPLGF